MRLRDFLTIAAICGIAGFSACNPAPRFAPPTVSAGSSPSLKPYRIQVGDILAVRLLLNPDLDEEVVVRPDGRISTTVVSDELALGRTVPELTVALKHGYASILHNPHLTVILKTFSPTRIYVGGEVAKPGESITVGLRPTLSQAIVRAGGLKGGDADKVFIIRRGRDDVPQFLSTNLQDVIRAHDPEADLRLEPYDVVYIPRDGIAEVYHFLSNYVVRLVPVIWGFSYKLNQSDTSSRP